MPHSHRLMVERGSGLERFERERWLEKMLARWELNLTRLCYAYLGDAALAEDAVQEAFEGMEGL